jgi:Cu-Zn family superoxide dismutase
MENHPMRLIHTTLFVAVAALGLSACNKQPENAAPATPAEATAATTPAEAPPPMTGPTADTAATATAVAELAPTQGNETKGSVSFKLVDGRVHVTGQVTGLKPGSEHGFHIHEKGDCSAPDGASAGGHFNPGTQDHGSVASDPHHGGDMPNITANAEGVATIDAPVSSNVNIGKGDGFDIIGRGLIVHADADDYTTQPTGNAGARLACAVIKAP